MRRLTDDPIDYQLTVHRNNYNYFNGDGSFERDYKLLHIHQHKQHYQKQYAIIYGLTAHYGSDKINSFIDECILMKDVGHAI